ncbi:MAG TPA: protein UsfY [Mycobacterium sp.]|uniref:protein UsfY n=1 Tax=Mycobacterium sp. TaxID=1785 RepID=UPI002D624364|nr:protein UsfY [Mycobacterium sp.]HXY64783.1 protein UsfY [Mycobacterium sp.]
MGDTFHDPVDHVRTTRLHAGESLIDPRSWPGHLLIVIGVVAIFRCLATFGAGHSDRGVIAAAIAIVAVTSGVLWLVVEHRRVCRVEDRWHEHHPGVQRQRPAS